MNKLFRCIFTVILVGVSSVIMAQDGLGAMNANSYRVGLNKSWNTSLRQDSKNNPGKSFLYEGRAENIEKTDVARAQNVVYIQNETINSYRNVNGDRVLIGYDVTTSKSYGNVTVKSGASLQVNSSVETVIKNGFECEKGATLTVQ